MKASKKLKQSHKKYRSWKGAAHIVEFAAALSILLLLVIPTIAGVNLLISLAAGQYVTSQALATAFKAASYDRALETSVATVYQFNKSGLASLANIRPAGGYKSCGVDLYVDVQDKVTKHVETFGPNRPYIGNIDPERKIYFYRIVTQFSAGWQLSNSSQGVPLYYVNTPLSLKFSDSKIVEHPDGICLCVQSLASPKSSTPGEVL